MSRMIALGLGSSLALAVFLTAFPAESEAKKGLYFCNKTRFPVVQVAVARKIGAKRKQHYRVDGWYNVKRGRCVKLVGGALRYRYYYYLAKTPKGSKWSGKYPFCVRKRPFTITGQQGKCSVHRARKESFRILDVGRRKVYTIDLTSK